MEHISLAKTTIYKMTAAEYDKQYDANVKKQYGEETKALYWAEKVDKKTGELVANTAEMMLEYEDGSFAYTSRFITVKATFWEALKVMLNSMEEI